MMSKRFHIAITFIPAMCSIIYELVIAQTLSLLAANTVIWYSVTVGLFLLGMGFGAFIGGRLVKNCDALSALIKVELLLSLCGALVVAGVHFLHMIYAYKYVWGQIYIGLMLFYGGTFLLVLAVGTLTGIELPLLVRLGTQLKDSEGGVLQKFSTTLGVDYFGSLVGALLFPIVLLPNFETFTIGLITAALNTAVTVALVVHQNRAGAFRLGHSLGCIVLSALLLFGFLNRKEAQQYFLRKYYYYLESSDSLKQVFARMKTYPKVVRRKSPYQKIDLFQDVSGASGDELHEAYTSKYEEKPDFPKNRYLFLNGDFQFNSSYEEIYHEFFAHVPLMVKGSIPSEVLVLGGGDGFLVRELLKHPQIKHIRHIDLDSKLIEFAKTDPTMLKMNGGSFLNQRVHTEIRDAYQFVRAPDRKYSAVYIDFPAPADYNLAKLYSREFFQFIKDRLLEEGGFLVFDSTGTGDLTYPDQNYNQQPTEYNDWPVYYHTIRAAGYEEIVPYVTTLEFQNPDAAALLKSQDGPVIASPDMLGVLQAANNSLEAEVILKAIERASITGILGQHVMSFQQGFLILGKTPGTLKPEYIDFGIDLHILNKKRFDLSFGPKFPRPAEIDWSKVNSIMRPTFPTLPVWQPRVPF